MRKNRRTVTVIKTTIQDGEKTIPRPKIVVGRWYFASVSHKERQSIPRRRR